MLFSAMCLAVGQQSSAATYYVDRTDGSDANSGTSPSAPWRHAPGMAAYSGAGSLAPGDVVYFDSADTWDVGEGTSGLYLVGGVEYVGNEWGSGQRARIRATADFEAGVVRFRDHPSAPTVFRGFEVDANGHVATGIDVNHGFWQRMDGATKRIEDNVVHGVRSSQRQGQYRYGIIVSNHGGRDGYAENVEIIGNLVYDVARDGINLYPGDGNADSRIRNLLVRGNEVYGTGADPDYCCGAGILIKGFVVDATIERNYVHDVKGASIFVNGNETNHFGTGPTNVHIRHNIVTNSTRNGAILIYDGSGGNDPKDLKIYGNIVYNSTVNGGLVLHRRLAGRIHLHVANNTFLNAPVRIQNSRARFDSFEFRNNIISFSDGLPLSDPGGKVTVHTNNLYHRARGATLVQSRGRSFTAANLTKYESSAIGADPLFNDSRDVPTGFLGTHGSDLAPNASGLDLRSDSPARDAGATLAPIFGTSINNVTRPGDRWDLGAYEATTH
jgi:hypothetical protein